MGSIKVLHNGGECPKRQRPASLWLFPALARKDHASSTSSWGVDCYSFNVFLNADSKRRQ
jgi:hypothetical protein